MKQMLKTVDALAAGLERRESGSASSTRIPGNPFVRLTRTASTAMTLLKENEMYGSASSRGREILERRRLTASRNLRRALAATITELDTAVMNDLMRVVKRLGKGGTQVKDNGLDRLKLTLELMEMAVKRAPSNSPDHLVWLFNTLYKGLGWIAAQEGWDTNMKGVNA